MDVTVGWCSEFEPAWVHELKRACRPPVQFQYRLGGYLACAGEQLSGRVIIDEDLGVAGLSPGVDAAIAGSDIVYLCSHGQMDGTTYRFRLRRGEWKPTDSPPQKGPAVLVLDTCNLVRVGVDPRNSDWARAGQWSPAIVLGFVGPATSGKSASLRGALFAEHLANGETYANAWFRAIKDSQRGRHRDAAIALAFGSTSAEARAHLDAASLANRPARTVADFYCREIRRR